jgi:hypothetical protein
MSIQSGFAGHYPPVEKDRLVKEPHISEHKESDVCCSELVRACRTPRPERISNILEAGHRLRSGASSKTTHGWQGALITAESTDFSRGSASTSYDHNLVLIEKLAGFRQLGQFTHQLRTNL